MSRLQVRRQPSGWTAVAAGVGAVLGLATLLSAIALLVTVLVQVMLT